jgi:hypothetical protein
MKSGCGCCQQQRVRRRPHAAAAGLLARQGLRETPVPEQPSPIGSGIWYGEAALTLDESAAPLRELHDRSLVDFVNVGGFGYIKNRRYVAGFQPHRFRDVPAGKQWTVLRVELVGLLRHESPVVMSPSACRR